jgi:SAM-dependent methyltransferase
VRWLESIASTGWTGEPLYERLFHLSAIDYAHAHILDVGSGPMSIFEPIAPAGAHVTAYDSLAEEYNRVAPGNRFKVQADLPDAQFSLITILNCLDHMLAPDELVAALRSRLAPQGEVWIFCNIGQPYDPKLHPQNSSIQDLARPRRGLVSDQTMWPRSRRTPVSVRLVGRLRAGARRRQIERRSRVLDGTLRAQLRLLPRGAGGGKGPPPDRPAPAPATRTAVLTMRGGAKRRAA